MIKKRQLEKKIIHLDCTLRDGGYYNNWDFKEELINDYLEAVSLAGIDIAEIGFRFINKIGLKGACAFCSEDFLQNINIPPNLSIGIMLKSSDLEKDNFLNLQVLDQLVPLDKSDSALSLIRIATSINHLKLSLEATNGKRIRYITDLHRGFLSEKYNFTEMNVWSDNEHRTL